MMKFFTLLSAVLLGLPAAAVQPWIDPETGRPELPLPGTVRESLPDFRPRTVELFLRADPDGFSSVEDPALSVNLTLTAAPGRALSVRGQAGPLWLDGRVWRTRRVEADEVVDGLVLKTPYHWVTLEPSRSSADRFLLNGLAETPVELELKVWEGAVRLWARAPGLDLIGREQGRRLLVRGRYLEGKFDAPRLAVLASLAVAVQLDAPRRRRMK